MISIRDVTKKYGDRVVLDRISLTVTMGEMLGLLGPNGAGKTTTMRIVTGFLPPTEGTVLIDGVDIYEHPIEIKKRIGYMPEQPPLYSDMTTRECLFFVGEIHGLSGARLSVAIDRAAELCGISDMLGRLTGNLSKGYRQRVGLAQALIHDPDVLILDEPTAGLDPQQIIEVRQLIRRLGQERTVIISSHILAEITNICRSVAIIDRGKILAVDSIEALSQRLSKGNTVKLRVRRPERIREDSIAGLPGVMGIVKTGDQEFTLQVAGGDEVLEAVSAYCVEAGSGLVVLTAQSMTLEDIFLKVVSGGTMQ